MTAIATGGALDGLLAALQQREARLARLQAERAALLSERRLEAFDVNRARRELLDLAGSWRQVLVDDPTHAMPVVSALLAGRVRITPTSAAKTWEIRGHGTLAGLFMKTFARGLASLTIPSWNQIADFLESMRQLRNSSGFAA